MSERTPAEHSPEELSTAPERRSGLLRITNIDPEGENAAREAFAALLKDQHFEAYEREKSAAEGEVITGILRSMPEFVRDYGGQPVEHLSEANVHLVDEASFPEKQREGLLEDDVAGRYDFASQRVIVLPDKDSLLTTAQRTVHEVLHIESLLSFTAKAGSAMGQPGKTVLHLRRIGLGVFNSEHTKRFFRDLDEAMVEELAARFDARYFSKIPALTSDIARRADFRETAKPDRQDEIAAVVSTQSPDGRWKTTAQSWRYESPRRVLRDLIAKLYAAHPDQFASEEAVFNLFAKAVFTGKLLELGRLVEKTLGKGAFRKLGEETMLTG